MTDTVGFIRKLPHQLVEAFSATLEEALGADLVLHVVDASVPEDELHRMMAAVDEVLDEIGAGDTPRLLALNKVDLLKSNAPARTPPRPRALPTAAASCSASTPSRYPVRRGTASMTSEAIEARFLATLRPMELLVPYQEGGTLSELHDLAGELEREDTAEGVRSAPASRFRWRRASSASRRTARPNPCTCSA